MKRQPKPRPTAGAVIHDHFDGSAHCIECGGPCLLTGSARMLTNTIRWIYEYGSRYGRGVVMWVRNDLIEAGYDPAHFMERAKGLLPVSQEPTGGAAVGADPLVEGERRDP